MERISFSEMPKGAYAALAGVQGFVDHSGLDHSLIHLVKLRVSYINSCAYCIDMHYKDAIAAGEDAKRLYSLPAWRKLLTILRRSRLCWRLQKNLLICSPTRMQIAFTKS